MRLIWVVLISLSLGLPLFAQQPQPILPDPRLTPGDVFDVTAGDVCTPGYSRKVRNVPQSVKEEVYREYGITEHHRGEYECDHLISLELGGSNSIKNLWPQSYRTRPWNARVKDRLENRLHELVCSGKLDLKTAQQAIASNWIEAYKKYVGPEPKALGRPSEDERAEMAAPASTPAAAGQVWVNTRSGKYWRPGSRYYGKTKQGKFMSEGEAQKQGFQPAHGTGE
ncbi:MAG: hypothetical protein JO015_14620 [Verrucomicrobia bacterium]|nr:hypothetical protein [Verrucomicrobiota bacterium]